MCNHLFAIYYSYYKKKFRMTKTRYNLLPLSYISKKSLLIFFNLLRKSNSY